MKPLNVLMFGWEFPPHNSGGLGVACYGLARALAREGAHITFVLPRKADVSADFMNIVFANEQHVSIRTVTTILSPYLTSEKYSSMRSLFTHDLYGWNLFDEVERYAREGRRIALEGDFDVIHAHDWLSFGAGIAAKEATGKPLVLHVHATAFDHAGGKPGDPAIYAIERESMEKADAVIAISEFTKNTIIHKYGIREEKVHVVHNGIDRDMYPDEDPNLIGALEGFKRFGKKIVLFVGRLTLMKGPDYFISAAKRVIDYYPQAIFVVAGSGDMEHRMISDAACLGIGDKVFFAGFLRDAELMRVYKMADLYVMPSVSEPFGLTPLEALMSGTPVLISKQSGVSEVVTHALKVDFWDIDEMANQIVSVLTHSSLRKTLAENGSADIARLSWQKSAQKCLAIYQTILAKTPIMFS